MRPGGMRCSTAEEPCYTGAVPTTRPRHFVTETDELAAALDQAAERWPELSRAQLIVRLALEGEVAAERQGAEKIERRRKALERLKGSFTGIYGPGYLEGIREDWPA